MTSLFPPKESLVSDIVAGDGNIEKPFYGDIVISLGLAQEIKLSNNTLFIKNTMFYWQICLKTMEVLHLREVSGICAVKARSIGQFWVKKLSKTMEVLHLRKVSVVHKIKARSIVQFWVNNCLNYGIASHQGSIRYLRAVLGQKLSKTMELLLLREVSGICKD